MFRCPIYHRREYGDFSKTPHLVDEAKALSITSVTLSTQSVLVLKEKRNRKYLGLTNLDLVNTIYISIGSTTTPASQITFRLRPGESKEFSGYVPDSDIFAVSGYGTPILNIAEGL